ncbi:Protein scabrous [Araneus ventricosus]|uniref:Protein scabrous n=1 Tax=Araneus ventricosus TaxID=182803 RepID=A0A4Y2GTT4_ARAVE|nr:Protein scabrous [Araneus ventricosus]
MFADVRDIKRINRERRNLHNKRNCQKEGDQILANIGPIRNENKPVVVTTINPWSEEGSGDLLGEALFPAITPKNEVHLTGESQKETGKAVAVSNNINGNEANEKILNLSKQMHMVQKQTHLIQERCIELINNVTDDVKSYTALLDNLQDDLSSLWKRVVKVDFNAAQSQAALDVLERDWIEDRKSINNLQNGSNAILVELNEHSKRLLALEMQTTNLTLQRCQNDGETYKSHLQIQNMDLRLTQIDHRIDESLKLYENHRKSNENIFRSYRDALANIARKTHNMSGEILSLTNTETNMRLDIDKFVKQLPKDCAKEKTNGIILIEVPSLGPLEVFCDTTSDGGPWITVQRRFNGSESFFRDWAEYRNGFGDLKGEFWLGNKALHLLTRKRRMKLHIDMWDIQDRSFYAEYETFRIRSELDQYAIEISNHSGNASDALTSHVGMGFSTFDKDNDASSANCAVHHTGGWWYQHCHRADLNGRYSLGMTWYDEYSQEWLQLVRVEMKIAPNEF